MNRAQRRAIESARLGRPLAALVRDGQIPLVRHAAAPSLETVDPKAIVPVRGNPPKRIGPRPRGVSP